MTQTSRPRRVLYVIWSLGLGGAEQVVLRLAMGLDRTRFTPIICCLNAMGVFATHARRANIEVIALHKRGPYDVRIVWRLAQVMRRSRIDVVHTHLWGANLWGRLAARLAGVPVVIATEHNVDLWKRWYHLLIDRWLAGWTTQLIAVAGQVREFYEQHGVARGRWQVLYNGVDLRSDESAEAADHAGPPVIGWVGRLVPAKAPGLFVEAFARAARDIPALKALIVGDGPLRADTDAHIRRLGLERHVSLLGLRQDVPELLTTLDALVFSSEREGFSMAMLEAMAAGVPVIATRVGGTPELIEDGVSGLLVPPGDPALLAARIVELIRDPAKRAAIRRAGLARVQAHFSLRRMVRAHETLYADGPQLAPRPTRIVYIIDDLGVGGAQRQLVALVKALPRAQYAPHVISLSTTKAAYAQELRDAGIPLTLIPQRGAVDLRALLQLYRVVRRGRFAIAQTWLFTADLYGRLAAWWAGVPRCISSVRSVETDKPRRYVWADRWLAPLTDCFIVNADCVGRVLQQRERVPARKITRIYNGIAINGMAQPQPHRAHVVIGSIGRLAPVKGYDVLLAAFAAALAQEPRLRLLLVGDGPERAALDAQARALGVAAHVTFAGAQTDIRAWLERMDCLVSSSRYEGCSNAILEAMAVGRPVIATRVGGTPELIEDGVSGLLVAAEDVEAMAAAMLRLARDPGLARRMAASARARVQDQFALSRMARETITVYDQLLEILA